jgi:hypothetical protein
VMQEAVVGERVAMRTYQSVLEKDLPLDLRQMLERQYDEVRKVSERVNLLRGHDGKRLIVQLFDSDSDATRVIQDLELVGYSPDAIQKVAFDQTMGLYQGKGFTLLETLLSGGVGGVVWGIPFGILAGIGAAATAFPDGLGISPGPWLGILVFIAAIGLGASLGAFLSLFIGAGITEEDSHRYHQSANHGRILLMVMVEDGRSQEIQRVIDQGNKDSNEPAWGASSRT